MGFITAPTASLVKGDTFIFYVNKSSLATNTKVLNDSYFSNSNVWKSFSLEYESPFSEQKGIIIFDASGVTPSGTFIVSDKLIGVLRVNKFIINDFDGGSLTLNRDDLEIADFTLNWDVKIGPSQTIISKASETVFDVSDASNYEVGYFVKLFHKDNNAFEDGIRKITGILGNEIQIESAFSANIVTNSHQLRFPSITNCNYKQQSKFCFVSNNTF